MVTVEVAEQVTAKMSESRKPSRIKSVAFALFGAFLGFMVGKLSKSFEIIIIATPIGALIGYKFTNLFGAIFSFLFSILQKVAPKLFKQV